MPDLFDKSVVIFGCGNILFGDDGFGPAVVEHLKSHYILPDDVLALDVGTSIRDILFDILLSEKKPRRLIIVDAVDRPGKEPGELFELPVEEIPPQKTADFSLHQFPTVNMLQELKDQTGVEVTVLAAQVQEIPEEVQPGLSQRLQWAVKEAAARLAATVNAGKKD
ncbi:MAG: hydrogenase maturation protease [Deltaproteobacteria bacterium]|nr:hydrogenase maturation protease [Deltaproteobacteria bacterium]